MIKSYRNKGLKELFESGTTNRIGKQFHSRTIRRLDALNAATLPEDLNLPGFNFHGLEGKPKRYSIHVNGPYCVTFEFRDGDAFNVNFENYH